MLVIRFQDTAGGSGHVIALEVQGEEYSPHADVSPHGPQPSDAGKSPALTASSQWFIRTFLANSGYFATIQTAHQVQSDHIRNACAAEHSSASFSVDQGTVLDGMAAWAGLRIEGQRLMVKVLQCDLAANSLSNDPMGQPLGVDGAPRCSSRNPMTTPERTDKLAGPLFRNRPSGSLSDQLSECLCQFIQFRARVRHGNEAGKLDWRAPPGNEDTRFDDGIAIGKIVEAEALRRVHGLPSPLDRRLSH